MKKWLVGLLLIAGLVALTGCGGTRLQITNDSTLYLDDVAWCETYFGEMYPGASITKTVTAGSDSLYIMLYGEWYYTMDVIAVNEDQKRTYVITDDTLVYGPLSLNERATGKAVKLGDIRKP